MKAAAWIISFALASTFIISMMHGYIKSSATLICCLLTVILIVQGIYGFKEDICEMKEEYLKNNENDSL